jgi:nucleoside-diphosphate-sugar epimerase
MRNYFLTGCTGFIGESIVSELCRREDTGSIVLLTRDPQGRYPFYKMDHRVTLFEGSIVNCKFPGMQFTDIIHGSNESQAAEAHSNYYTMVEGSARILDWVYGTLHSRGGVIPRFLFLSSGAADSAASSYGQGKRLCEQLLRARNSLGKIARVYTLIGPKTPSQYAVGQFVKQATEEGRVTVYGGDNAIRSYLHVDDCARWLLKILDSGSSHVTYDIGGADRVSVSDVAQTVAEVFGVPLRRIKAHDPENVYVPDLTAALAIGCEQTISLKTALERIRDKTGIRNPNMESA